MTDSIIGFFFFFLLPKESPLKFNVTEWKEGKSGSQKFISANYVRSIDFFHDYVELEINDKNGFAYGRKTHQSVCN